MAARAICGGACASQYNVAFQRALVVWIGVGVWFYYYPPPATRRVTRGCDSSDNST